MVNMCIYVNKSHLNVILKILNKEYNILLIKMKKILKFNLDNIY